ncbi:hypothetical protein MACH09_41170 [Vibrio sp. MACH09]|uniref:hypothetical protein n=1 Tax=Vibrio sp. MACH09 TaxID=3025122 RepID=UPI002793322D|nr:hypothetical protein [Vibrio sp. MACH09]GLO63609.1 hypothetical protein MACH09_41170 [Vibrio sp. MACH09]
MQLGLDVGVGTVLVKGTKVVSLPDGGLVPHNNSVKLKVTRELIQAKLDNLPNGQGANYYVRQKNDGGYTVVRKDKSKSEKVSVTNEGNLFVPIKTQSNSEDLTRTATLINNFMI